MARDNRNKKEKEELLGIIKTLNKQVRHLKKEASRAQKQSKKDQALMDNFTESSLNEMVQEKLKQVTESPSKNKCPECKSEIIEITLGKLGTLVNCSNKKCSFRKRLKNGSSKS